MRKQMTKGMRCGDQCAWKAAEYKILSGVFTLIQRSTEAFSDPRSGRCAKTAPGAGPFPDSRAAEARRRGCHCRRCDGRVPAADGHRAYSAYDSADTDMPIVACVMCCAGLFGGCGQSGMKQDNTAISNSEEGKQEGTTEEKEVTGTIDEIKDFMFVVTDENDTPYSFTFEEKPEGLENVSNGDTVTVRYTGTISEVDPFEGEVISVEKAQ